MSVDLGYVEGPHTKCLAIIDYQRNALIEVIARVDRENFCADNTWVEISPEIRSLVLPWLSHDWEDTGVNYVPTGAPWIDRFRCSRCWVEFRNIGDFDPAVDLASCSGAARKAARARWAKP